MKITLDVSGPITGDLEARGALYRLEVADSGGDALCLEAPAQRMEELLTLALHCLQQAREQNVDVHFDLGFDSDELAPAGVATDRVDAATVTGGACSPGPRDAGGRPRS